MDIQQLFQTDLYLHCILNVSMHSLHPHPRWLGGMNLYCVGATWSSCDLPPHKAYHIESRVWFQFDIICACLPWSWGPLFQFYLCVHIYNQSINLYMYMHIERLLLYKIIDFCVRYIWNYSSLTNYLPENFWSYLLSISINKTLKIRITVAIYTISRSKLFTDLLGQVIGPYSFWSPTEKMHLSN